MFNVWEKDQVPYEVLTDNLFNLSAWQQNETADQQIIPFLGAGASVSGRPGRPKPLPVQPPADEQITECCRSLGIEGESAKLFMRMAAFLAVSLNQAEKDSPKLDDAELLYRLAQEASPPTARELARLFSNLSTYTAFKPVVDRLKELFPQGFLNVSEEEQIKMLKRLGRITKIADPPDPLTSITSYYENKVGRQQLWTKLSAVISRKNSPTLSHKLIAAAAKCHFAQPDVWRHYLILTTNYDCLMEDALERAGVDYVAVTTRKIDQKVLVRFSDSMKDAKRYTAMNSGVAYPDKWYLEAPKKLAIVCKIHGCLNPRLSERDDGVIISDNDYVSFISEMNTAKGAIPSYINTLMQDKPFLFLGYSLSDWNVRSVFESIRRKRGEDFGGQDYAATSYVGDYEQLFFQKTGVAILKTDLNAFATGVVAEIQKQSAINPERSRALVDRILSSMPEIQNKEAFNANP